MRCFRVGSHHSDVRVKVMEVSVAFISLFKSLVFDCAFHSPEDFMFAHDLHIFQPPRYCCDETSSRGRVPVPSSSCVCKSYAR